MNKFLEERYWYGLDQYINPLGLGTWQLAGKYIYNGNHHGWSHIEEKEALDIIDRSVNEGIRFFDTAAGYKYGACEKYLGQVLKNYEQLNTVVCTKIKLTETEKELLKFEENLRLRVESSLHNLSRDRIDILLIHNPPDDVNWSNFDTTVLENLVSEGKVRTYGVSAQSIKGVNNVINHEFGTCIEWSFNLLERRPISQIFSMLKEKNMNFISRNPLARGFLSTQKIIQRTKVFHNDFRSSISDSWKEWVYESIELAQLTSKEIENISNLALRFCLDYQSSSVVIPGINRYEYLLDYLDIRKVDALFEEFIQKFVKKTKESYPPWS